MENMFQTSLPPPSPHQGLNLFHTYNISYRSLTFIWNCHTLIVDLFEANAYICRPFMVYLFSNKHFYKPL